MYEQRTYFLLYPVLAQLDLPLLLASKTNTSPKIKRPNFVFFLTDDQDVLLGGVGMSEGHPLPRAIAELRERVSE